MKKNLFLMAMAIMALGFTACTSDNDDNPMPEVVTDDKPFPYDSEIDESVRPGDDFYRYALRIPDNTNTWKGIYLKNGQKIIK